MAISPETRLEICEHLADGKSLREICRMDGMPSESYVRKCAIQDPDFGAQYARARDLGLDVIADEIIEISDTTEVGVERTTKPDGSVETKEGDMLGHRRLRVDSRKWYLSKLAPKRYGDKIDVGVTGSLSVSLSQEDATL